MIKAIILDFDGTILDTELPVYLGWQRTYARHGQELSMDEYSEVVGSDYSRFDPRATLEKRIGHQLEWAELDADRRNFHLAMVGGKDVLPGVRELIHETKDRGLLCGVASSSTSDWVEGHLKRLGLRPLVDFVSCANPPVPPKPAPDVYLRVLEGLDVAASESVAIEDSPHGVTAALAAGIACLGVPNEVTSRLIFPAHVKQAASLENMRVDALLELLDVRQQK
jgi:HAD superfamily hydrolase (TIGR01509 family)